MLELMDEIILDHLMPVFENLNNEQIYIVLESDEYITEVKAIKQKVIRDLMLTIRYGKCQDGFKVDSNTKQCVKMSTAEQKMFHKLATHSAKMFRAKGTAAKAVKAQKYDKSMNMRDRLNLQNVTSKKN